MVMVTAAGAPRQIARRGPSRGGSLHDTYDAGSGLQRI